MLVDRLAVERVELVEHRAQRHRHVVARVAVGDREDVQVVDLLAAVLELRERGGHDPAEADQALVGHGRVVHRQAAVIRRRAGRQACLVTLPALRQRVQTYSRRGVPPTSMRTFCRFGLKRRLVATIEWLRLFPNAGPFLHE